MRPDRSSNVFLCVAPVDFRKSINGLAALVQSSFELDQFKNALFVLYNRGHVKIKILYWERNGFCLWQKRLEQDRNVSTCFGHMFRKITYFCNG